MKRTFFAILVIFGCFVGWIGATISLANSGYPMLGANPQRNNKMDKPVLCSDISNGKTTVLNVVWKFPADSFSNIQVQAVSYNLIQDGKGFGYVVAYNSGTKMFKINTTDGSYDTFLYYVPTGTPEITMLNENKFYYSTQDKTMAVETSTFTETLSFIDPVSYGEVPMAPYKNDWMVKTRQVTDLSGDAIMYFKDSLSDVDYTQPNTDNWDFTGKTIQPKVLVYKSTTSAMEFPVVYAAPSEFGGPSAVASPAFFTSLSATSIMQIMIVDDEIILLHKTNDGASGLLVLDAVTGAITLNKTYDQLDGSPFFINQQHLMYHNGKALAVASVNSESYFVELMNAQLIPTNGFLPFGYYLTGLTFSNVDETVLSFGFSQKTHYFEIMGMKWDTFEVNVRARIPEAGNDATMGSVIIGDNCNVHVGANHVLYTLAPLPIQKVIPILECVDRNTSTAYFTYNNTGSQSFLMPQVDDRNNLSPLNVAPIEDFSIGLGPRYPFAAKVVLSSDTNTWVLEDYVLSFTITPDLYCPETITIVIILTADGPFPSGFDVIVRDTFVNVTGISDSRVTLKNSAKRSVKQQSTLETELEVAPDPNNTEKTPAEVIQDFTQSQSTFQQQIQQEEGAPEGIDVNLVGKAPSTAVQGEIPPAPVAPPTSSSPVATGGPIAAPVSKPTSVASTLHVITNIIIMVMVAVMLF